jgi:hypothetical protein
VIKRIGLLLAAALLVATMAVAGLAAPAFAAQCPDGDQATNERGVKSCPTEGGPGKTGAVETDSVKGSFSTKNEVSSECTQGAGGSDNCPRGQF